MKRIEIETGGVAYPCGTLTMGSLLRFERETGKNVMEMLQSPPEGGRPSMSFTDVGTLLWCCAASATRAEGREFTVELLDFLDACPPSVAEEWLRLVLLDQGEAESPEEVEIVEGEKKSPRV